MPKPHFWYPLLGFGSQHRIPKPLFSWFSGYTPLSLVDARDAAEVRRGTSSIHFFVSFPGRPVISVPECRNQSPLKREEEERPPPSFQEKDLSPGNSLVNVVRRRLLNL